MRIAFNSLILNSSRLECFMSNTVWWCVEDKFPKTYHCSIIKGHNGTYSIASGGF